MLRDAGISNLVMLTGDSEQAASRTAEMLGITQYHAQVLPEDKHRYVEELKAEGKRVIMVGDGINDAPALAAANVSVAMSDASDIAREAADITLRGANLTELATLRKLSERLMKRIHSNYRFILGFYYGNLCKEHDTIAEAGRPEIKIKMYEKGDVPTGAPPFCTV